MNEMSARIKSTSRNTNEKIHAGRYFETFENHKPYERSEPDEKSELD